MYNFIDVIDNSEGTFLPSEALKINGKYIENMIPGYRTLTVAGREALTPEVYTFETGIRDGSGLSSKRYPARTIIVTYQLIAENSAAFRAAYNALGGILDVVDAQLIFADEPDKYFTGTVSNIGEIEPGRNAVVGQFEITCLDPFKYSVDEYEATLATDGSGILIEYGGTYKSFPTLQVDFAEETEPDTLTGKGECGYVAFFNEHENIVQLGDPDEVDGLETGFAKSQAVINQKFCYSNSWTSGANALWQKNAGNFSYQQNGTLGLKLLPNSNYYYLTPTSYGSASNGGHGASFGRNIPADAAGDTNNDIFDLYFKPVFAIASGAAGKKTYGEWALILVGASGENVAKVRIVKNSDGNKAALYFYVNEATIYKGTVDISAGGKQFGKGENNPLCRVSRTATGYVFVMGGVTKTFRLDTGDARPNVKKVEFMFSQYGNQTPVAINGVMTVKFTKNYCQTYKDIPNKFQSNDVLEVDCRNGKVLLNKAEKPELGALGNDWEQFYLSPGLNQIGFSYSNWVDEAPVPTVRYREVYL